MSEREPIANGLGLLFICSFPVACCATACLLTKSFPAGREDQNVPWDFRSADFELDGNAYELRRNGNPLKLERIPLDLLFLLVDQRNRLVTRE
jgi:DNA-binding response OmpR family regulator